MANEPCTEEEKELAQTAHMEFEKQNYDSCITILKKLLAKRPNDIKVQHNKAVAEFFQSKQRKTAEFQKQINILCSKAQIKFDSLDNVDDIDHCALLYNKAILLYHNYQYQPAIDIVYKLFQFIESLDESLARKVAFLLLELYLSTHQADKALNLVNYLEKLLFTSDAPKEKEKEEEKPEIHPNEIYRPKLQHYKARCFLLLKSAKACKREIKSLMNSGESTCAIYLRSQLDYLRGNYRKSLKVLNSANHKIAPAGGMSLEEAMSGGDMLPVLYYMNMACIHFYMGKPYLAGLYNYKAFKEFHSLMEKLQKEEKDSLVLYNHNLCLKYKLKYNFGVLFLHTGRPAEAFEHFLDACQLYHTNPRIWLRLAECCIMKHKSSNADEFNIQKSKQGMVQGQVGTGPFHKILLSPCHTKSSTESPAIPQPTLEFASICLKNALLLLPKEESSSPANNSESVSPNSGGGEEGASSANGGNGGTSLTGTSSNGGGTNDAPTTPPVVNTLPANLNQDLGQLRNSILAASAYVTLCLGDIYQAQEHAASLLAQPKLSGLHKFLVCLYQAEALMHKDDITGMLPLLDPENITSIDPDLPHLSSWYPKTLSTAKVIMQYNLALALTLRGEWDKANETLRLVGVAKGPGTDVPIHAIMLAMYIHLQQGHGDLAMNIIKQYLPQYR